MSIRKIVNYFKSGTLEEKNISEESSTGLPFKKEYLFDLLNRYENLKINLDRKELRIPFYTNNSIIVHFNNFRFYMKKYEDKISLDLQLKDDCFGKSLTLYKDSLYRDDDNTYRYKDGSWTSELINTISEIEDKIIIMQELIQERDAQLLSERQAEQDMIEAHYYNKYEGKKAISSHELLLDAEKLVHQSIDKLHDQEAFDLMDKAITKIHKAYWIGHSEICLNKIRE